MAPKRKSSAAAGEGTSKRAKKQKVPATPTRHSRRKAGESVEVLPADDIDALTRKMPSKDRPKHQRTPTVNSNENSTMPSNPPLGLPASTLVTPGIPASDHENPAVLPNAPVDPPALDLISTSIQSPSEDTPLEMDARAQDHVPPFVKSFPRPGSQLDLIQARLNGLKSQSDHHRIPRAGDQRNMESQDALSDETERPSALLGEETESAPKVKIEEEHEATPPAGVAAGGIQGTIGMSKTPQNPSRETTVDLDRHTPSGTPDPSNLTGTKVVKTEAADPARFAADSPPYSPQESLPEEPKIKLEHQDIDESFDSSSVLPLSTVDDAQSTKASPPTPASVLAQATAQTPVQLEIEEESTSLKPEPQGRLGAVKKEPTPDAPLAANTETSKWSGPNLKKEKKTGYGGGTENDNGIEDNERKPEINRLVKVEGRDDDDDLYGLSD